MTTIYIILLFIAIESVCVCVDKKTGSLLTLCIAVLSTYFKSLQFHHCVAIHLYCVDRFLQEVQVVSFSRGLILWSVGFQVYFLLEVVDLPWSMVLLVLSFLHLHQCQLQELVAEISLIIPKVNNGKL